MASFSKPQSSLSWTSDDSKPQNSSTSASTRSSATILVANLEETADDTLIQAPHPARLRILPDEPRDSPTRPDGHNIEKPPRELDILHNVASLSDMKRGKLQTGLIVMSLCSALFLAALDITIITTAIPVIVAEFGSPHGYTWIGSAYLLANCASVASWGKLSDIWGRKPILLMTASVFWIGSLLAGVSKNMPMLIAARAVQGAGGGGVIGLVNICITDLFSMRDRSFYYGIMGMVWALAGGLGPVLGGVFSTSMTWRWCFYINLPVAGMSIIILTFVLDLHNPRTSIREGLAAIDWLGSLTIVGGTLMFLLGLEFGGVSYPWSSTTVICLLVFGVFTLVLFVLTEWKLAKFPVIPLRLFKERSNVAAFAVCAFHGCVFISASYYLPLYFQAVLGASSLTSGVLLLPYSLSLSIVSSIVGLLVQKTGKYVPFIVGATAIMTLGFGLFIDLPANKNLVKIICYQTVAGIGVGPNFQSPLIALQNHVQARDMASATAMYAFIRQLFTSISVVIGGVVFQNEQEKQYPMLVQQLGPDLASRLSGEQAAANVDFVGRLEGPEGDVARGSYAKSIRTMFIMYTVFSGLSMLLSLGVKSKKLSTDHKEHRTGLEGLTEDPNDGFVRGSGEKNSRTAENV